MQVLLNGKQETVEKQMNLAEFLQSKGMNFALIIVEYNGLLIKEPLWSGVVLQDNDRLEVLKFVGGG